MLPFLILFLSNYTISEINYHYYKVRTTVEVKSPQFLAAYSSLTRVNAGKRMPVIPVSQQALNTIYKVSPAFAKLKPYLNGNIGEAWAYVSNTVYPQYPGEIAGGWFMWAFRYSVQAAGYYKNGKVAMNYYQSIANQVNNACNIGSLSCLASTDNMYPPLTSMYVSPFISSVKNSFNFIAGFQDYNPTPLNVSGSQKSINLFSNITNEPATNVINSSKINILNSLGSIYQKIFPFITYLATISFIILLFLKKSYKNPLFIITGLIGMTVLVRIFLLSLVNVTSFPAINTLYFACAYPLLIIFGFFTLCIVLEPYSKKYSGTLFILLKKFFSID